MAARLLPAMKSRTLVMSCFASLLPKMTPVRGSCHFHPPGGVSAAWLMRLI
jgi:hypothetical protein